MEENKKSGGGDVRAFALSWDGEWDKARKLVFSFITTLAHGGALRSPLTSLAARKKAASRRKSRLRRKKTAPRLFVHFHPTNPTIPPQKKEHSLLVLPSVNTIINFATEFFEMFTKLQSEHPQKVFQVFQVFRVFQVFHVRFWTTKPPDFGPNPN